MASGFEDTTFEELATYFRDDPFKTVPYVPTGEDGGEAADLKTMLLEVNRDGNVVIAGGRKNEDGEDEMPWNL